MEDKSYKSSQEKEQYKNYDKEDDRCGRQTKEGNPTTKNLLFLKKIDKWNKK